MKKSFLILLFLISVFALSINILDVQAEGSYVTAIKVDGKDLEGFASSNLGPYSLKVDSSKSSITIGYILDTGYSFGQCSVGEIALKYGNNELKCEVGKEGEETKTYQINIERPDNRSGDNALTALMVGNNKVILTDANEYNVSVTTDKVEVKGTLPAGASFVDAYGERTGDNAVKLTDGKASIEIKVKAENENIRTYKINITKTDFKSNDATLKELKIDEVKEFNFKKTTYEYDVSVKYNVEKVKITATANHEKATVEYKEEVTLKNGVNNIIIKVTAEDGTIKEYKLNITREEEKPIVSNIEITGIELKFDPKTYNYKIETKETTLDMKITLRSETAKYEIVDNENLQNGSTVKVIATDGDETATYNFKIVNKEEVEKDIPVDSSATTGKTNFFKQNEMLISLIIFGVGAFSLLAAIIVKKSQVK